MLPIFNTSSAVITAAVITAFFIAFVTGAALTSQENEALKSLKSRVLDKLPEAYMKEDLYLTRFLRAKEFNVDEAENMINEDLEWRKDQNMDSILSESFEDIESRGYVSYMESVDREGKPIITANIGDWDLRKAIVSGIENRLERHVVRSMEKAAHEIRELQASGKNISQWDFLINMDTYNKPQHGCVECMPFYLYIVNTYENHYPEQADLIMLVNTPQIFDEVLKLMRPMMSPITNAALKVFDYDKPKWEAELEKHVDKSQLPPDLGGTKVYTPITG